METVNQYDAVVFGADLFQLEKAVRLAESGKSVLVLTKCNLPGGEYAAFRRGKFEFRPASFPPEQGNNETETALALEKKLRDLGGTLRYKADVRQVTQEDSGAFITELQNGTLIRSETAVFQPDLYYIHNSLKEKVLLALDIPYDQLREAAEGAAGAEVFASSVSPENSILTLSGNFDYDSLPPVNVENYFMIKDRIAGDIIERFEKASGLRLSGHILEMDAVTPFTLMRNLDIVPSDKPGCLRLGGVLHPPVQFGKVLKVTDRGHAKSFVIGPDPERGTKSLAYFRAGQYISILQPIGDAFVCKPYSICASPKDVLKEDDTSYTFMIERNPGGFFSPHALDTWVPGTKLVLSGPLGFAYHLPFRDAGHVVALAGSSGITPFYSMAAAIADGIEHFDLTILYGSRTADTILLKDELDEIVQRSGGKVRVIHVLSDERKEGYEHGFFTTDLIRKYAPEEDYSIFICGPAAMYDYLHRELPKLGLPQGRIRFELPGEFGDPALDPEYPKAAEGKTFRLTVRELGKERTVSCRSDQTLMQAIERSGIIMEADCRSGQCGWCRSLLVSGEVFVPKSRDGRRKGDAEYGWVHPCVTYPLSDIVLEISNH